MPAITLCGAGRAGGGLPRPASASVDGDTLTVTFSRPVGGFSGASGFTLDASGGAATVTYTSGTGTTTIVFTVSREIDPGETVTMDYDPGTGNVAGTTGDLAEMAAFSDYPVANAAAAVGKFFGGPPFLPWRIAA